MTSSTFLKKTLLVKVDRIIDDAHIVKPALCYTFALTGCSTNAHSEPFVLNITCFEWPPALCDQFCFVEQVMYSGKLCSKWCVFEMYEISFYKVFWQSSASAVGEAADGLPKTGHCRFSLTASAFGIDLVLNLFLSSLNHLNIFHWQRLLK